MMERPQGFPTDVWEAGGGAGWGAGGRVLKECKEVGYIRGKEEN